MPLFCWSVKNTNWLRPNQVCITNLNCSSFSYLHTKIDLQIYVYKMTLKPTAYVVRVHCVRIIFYVFLDRRKQLIIYGVAHPFLQVCVDRSFALQKKQSQQLFNEMQSYDVSIACKRCVKSTALLWYWDDATRAHGCFDPRIYSLVFRLEVQSMGDAAKKTSSMFARLQHSIANMNLCVQSHIDCCLLVLSTEC